MAVDVGGISVGIGVNLSQFAGGIEEARRMLDNFRSSLNTIQLAGAIKGDPFSVTRGYLKTARSSLDEVFRSWSKSATMIGAPLDEIATKARNSTKAILDEFTKLSKYYEYCAAKTLDIENVEYIAKDGEEISVKPDFVSVFSKFSQELYEKNCELSTNTSTNDDGLPDTCRLS